MGSVISKPRYTKINHDPRGAFNRHGKAVMCEVCEREAKTSADGNLAVSQATWTGMRVPTARIMEYPFAMCDRHWREERLR